jgi:hypothetical protein
MFESDGCSPLRSDGFSFSSDVLYGGRPRNKKIEIFDQKIFNFFPAVHFFKFLVIKTLDPDWILIQIGTLFSLKCSVADPGCLSRILIFTHPGSRIPDPKTATKERGEKKFLVIPFYVATNFTKLKIILALRCRRK